jgi:hypothetical protein
MHERKIPSHIVEMQLFNIAELCTSITKSSQNEVHTNNTTLQQNPSS